MYLNIYFFLEIYVRAWMGGQWSPASSSVFWLLEVRQSFRVPEWQNGQLTKIFSQLAKLKQWLANKPERRRRKTNRCIMFTGKNEKKVLISLTIWKPGEVRTAGVLLTSNSTELQARCQIVILKRRKERKQEIGQCGGQTDKIQCGHDGNTRKEEEEEEKSLSTE